MSHLLDRLLFFRKNVDTFSGDLGLVTREDRSWEDGYRNRWDHDKVVRSTHGVNCTGSCSWNIFVKSGIVTWEMQATDYPRTRPDLPNHEPRGCPRGASASWYVYSGNRIKFPLVRRKLIELWRAARRTLAPVDAWRSIVGDPEKAALYKNARGRGGFVRVAWDEANELVGAATVCTARDQGPDRVAGFTPIPAFSMASFAAGTRFLSLIGGTCLSFYDWYCDLPPSSPMTWGEQTDVPESASWYDAGFLILWGSNVPQTRTPDAHFYTEVRYKGTKSVVISPDFNEAAKFADLWLHPKQRTDAALALAMGHVILKEFHLDRRVPYFDDYCRRFSDLPMLVRLERSGEHLVPGRLLRASDFDGALGQWNHAEWKTVGIDEKSGEVSLPFGSIGFRWADPGHWNLEQKDARDGREVSLRLSLLEARNDVAEVAFPYFGDPSIEASTPAARILPRRVPVKRLALRDGETLVATVFDLLVASHGIDRGLGGENVASSYDDDVPYTPAWQERITGVDRRAAIAVAREFAQTAEKTNGRSMVIIGCGVNQAYHTDMTYRAVIDLLVLCGCVGVAGGGWAHYVGQEKLRPQVGWATLAFALDWSRPPRHMNSTSYFYAHTDQFRYETVSPRDMLSPLAPDGDWDGSLIDYNVRAERMGWLPSSPQLMANPLEIAGRAAAAGAEVPAFVAAALESKAMRLACEDPDDAANFPRVLFVWRANLLGSSGKGHEYFLKHLLGTVNGVEDARDLGESGGEKPREIVWHDEAPRGKLDLLVTLDFRMSSTCIYSDVVLPSATWYEKNDLSTTDMHPFIHPLGAAIDPAWESRTDWDIFKGIARSFSRIAPGVLGVEKDVVLVPLQHDTAAELAQPLSVQDWKRGECEPVPGRTMPGVAVVERDYPNTYARFTALGPLVCKPGIGAKGISWSAEPEVELLRQLNGEVAEGPTRGLPQLVTDVQACETILTLSPETNGEVAVRAWEVLEKATALELSQLARPREHEKIRFADLVRQPRKIITAPTWTGIESDSVSYTAYWVNVNRLVPWRTLSGRQELYQDHPWMRAFGEAFPLWRPPLDTGSLHAGVAGGLVLNFLTPHQKWGIHSSFSENLLMLTLSRGGPTVWLNEAEAQKAGIADNDWVELYNGNGAVTARAVLSQRVMAGTCMMYHAQEKLVNTPGSPRTGTRGIHNSVTRVIPKPTHMIGGYAHLSYGLNYYGTIGANRDEMVVVHKLEQIDWMDGRAEAKAGGQA
jgi:nitrate reductase / nitrite oxidoreductase, alpha subunit